MDPAKYAALFATESREHIAHCNRDLLLWERDPASLDPIQGLLRSVHTLKGMAAAMGYRRLADLAHAFEHLLAGLRDRRIAPTPELVDLGFRAVDLLEQGVTLAAAGEAETLPSESLMAELGRHSDGDHRAGPVKDVPFPAHHETGRGLPVRVQLRAGAAMPGARAAIVLRAAATLGQVAAVTPAPEEWLGEGFDGGISFRLDTIRPADEVRSLLAALTDVAEVVVGRSDAVGGGRTQLRVDPSRLDALITLASELVVARNRLVAQLERSGDPELEEGAQQVSRLVSELQQQVLRVRMARVGEVFERFPRSVRDLGRQLGKRVRCDLVGADIELDRAILDELADPLLHLVRNAVDHGIEPPEERTAAGKAPEGRLVLSAVRERNAVLIEVADDGRGIDREAVLARARREGWVGSGAMDGGDDLLAVLARPGFSTAREVTDVSGRGVGIDVVAHWVRGMGGATGLTSQAGSGTTVTLRLPLTVALVPALLVGIDRERYAVPLGFVAETTRLPAGAAPGAGEVRYRGDAVRVIELVPPAPSPSGWRPGIILDVAGRRGALAVDTLFGQEDIVVSPLRAPLGTPGWVNGATILADGLPALVLDPAALV